MPAAVTPEAVEAKVIETIASFGPRRGGVTRDATFEALDVDSLDLVELAQVIEEEFGVALKGDDVKDIKTVGEADRPGGEPGLMSAPVVITGVGAVTPLGVGRAHAVRALGGGRGRHRRRRGAPARDFDPVEALGPKIARRTDRFAQFALAASDEALADAGWSFAPSPRLHRRPPLRLRRGSAA